MKNKKGMYGVVDPKLLDYLLATVLALMAVTALWVGIWITAAQTIEPAKEAFDLIGKAFLVDFNDPNYWLVLIQSVVFYGAALGAVILCLFALIKKRYRIIPGILSVIIAGFALCVEIAFVGIYANAAVIGIHGLFVVGLAILTVALLLIAYKIANFSLKLVVCDEMYKKYLEELEKQGILKEKEREIAGLSKSQAVYDAIYSNEEPTEKVEVQEKVEEPAKQPKKAKEKHEEPKIVAKEQAEDAGQFGIKANHFTFEKKLKMAKPVAREYFKEIKKYYEEIGFKSNLTKTAETFSYKNSKYAIITTAGKSGLKIYFKLSPADYEGSTLPFTDVSDKKKYEKTPLLFVVKSDLAVRRAKALMDDIKKALENEKK